MTVQVLESPSTGVFTLVVPRHLELSDVQVYLDRMGRALSDGTPFGCVFAWSDGRPRKTKEATHAEHEWLEQHRGQVGKACFGIAMISTPSLAGALPRLAMRAAGPRMFGCPCKVVGTEAEAHSWLAAQRSISRA